MAALSEGAAAADEAAGWVGAPGEEGPMSPQAQRLKASKKAACRILTSRRQSRKRAHAPKSPGKEVQRLDIRKDS
jgi:hypothetical protein